MKLKIPIKEIQNWSNRYSYVRNEDKLLQSREQIVNRGFLTKSEFESVCKWKSPRSSGHAKYNEDSYVEEITAFALSTNSERARIEVLTNLDGANWPTASVILHLYHQDNYPIVDYRALWSVGAQVPKSYDYTFWMSYVRFARKISEEAKVDMRVLDRALWQFSKENQPKGKK